MKFAEILQSGEWKSEKHVPVITAPEKVRSGERFTVEVAVGKEIAHPNTTEHHIRWIRLYFKPDQGKFAYDVALAEFNAHGEAAEGANKGPAYTEPLLTAALKINTSGTLLASAYCNIHGLWEYSLPVRVED